MNSRMLGIICMIGAAAAAIGTFLFTPISTMAMVLGIVWGVGSMAGLVGLIQLGALGESPVTRALGFVPIIGTLILVIGTILQLAGIIPGESLLYSIGWVMQLVGMVLVSILVIAARRWRGWRRFAPLLTIVIVPVAIGLDKILGGGPNETHPGVAFVFVMWIVLGFAVATAKPATAAERAAAA